MTQLFDFTKDIILQNEHSLLRPLTLDDYDDFWRISQKNLRLLQYSPQLIDTEKKMGDYIDNALKLRVSEQKYSFTIIDNQTKTVVGSTSFMNISPPNLRLEIGSTWLDPDVHGNGINRQNKLLMLSYAFEQLDYERVELKTDSRNLQSRKAILKIGAQFEGILRHHILMSDGFWRDTVYYAILKSEWPQIKQYLSGSH